MSVPLTVFTVRNVLRRSVPRFTVAGAVRYNNAIGSSESTRVRTRITCSSALRRRTRTSPNVTNILRAPRASAQPISQTQTRTHDQIAPDADVFEHVSTCLRATREPPFCHTFSSLLVSSAAMQTPRRSPAYELWPDRVVLKQLIRSFLAIFQTRPDAVIFEHVSTCLRVTCEPSFGLVSSGQLSCTGTQQSVRL